MEKSQGSCIFALEGSLLAMKQFGFPLAVCVHLQDQSLQFSDAQWTARYRQGLDFQLVSSGQVVVNRF